MRTAAVHILDDGWGQLLHPLLAPKISFLARSLSPKSGAVLRLAALCLRRGAPGIPLSAATAPYRPVFELLELRRAPLAPHLHTSFLGFRWAYKVRTGSSLLFFFSVI